VRTLQAGQSKKVPATGLQINDKVVAIPFPHGDKVGNYLREMVLLDHSRE